MISTNQPGNLVMGRRLGRASSEGDTEREEPGNKKPHFVLRARFDLKTVSARTIFYTEILSQFTKQDHVTLNDIWALIKLTSG